MVVDGVRVVSSSQSVLTSAAAVVRAYGLVGRGGESEDDEGLRRGVGETKPMDGVRKGVEQIKPGKVIPTVNKEIRPESFAPKVVRKGIGRPGRGDGSREATMARATGR